MKWLLFETRIGAWLLELLEAKADLAVVRASWLAEQEIQPAITLPLSLIQDPAPDGQQVEAVATE